ncbi:MAG: hypothetical protein N838_26530, partial [Thiohalocapsa sp. PB-PSB1]
MWQRILAILAARNREFYRDRAGLTWSLLMPIMMIVAFAFIFSGEPKALFKVGVIAAPELDMTTARASDQAGFLSTSHIDFIPVTQQDTAVAAAIAKVQRHQLDLLLDLRGFPAYWVNPDSTNGSLVEQLLLGAYAREDRPSAATPPPQRRTAAGEALRYVDWVLPGVLAMNVMFSGLWGVGWIVVRYRKNGVLRRLKATPLRPIEFLTAQVLSRLIVVSGNITLIYLAASMMLDFPMRGSFTALLLIYAAGALCMISIGLAVAARLHTEELANGLLNLLSWPMLLLSGVWFSMEGTSPMAQALSKLMPLTHLVDAARAIMIDGAGVLDILPQLALLLGIGALLLVSAARL